ncbi:MAG TPA: response regulator [Candidatus Ozemobacteraceae bacterium]|nr:response regulator [Candidatus Ozemobacteraceae bacterium]
MHELLLLQLKKVLNLPATQLREIRENPHSLNALLQNTPPHLMREVLREISSAYEEHELQNQRLNRALRISAREADELATELRRQEEQKYRLLFEHMALGFLHLEILFDASGEPVDARCLEANPAFLRMFSLTEQQVQGKHLLQLRPNFNRDLLRAMGEVANTGMPSRFEREDPITHRVFEVCLYRPTDKHLAALLNDVTERRREAEEKQRLELQMQQSQKLESLGLMAGGIAHDFNNLLTVIGGNIDICRHQGPLPRDVVENLDDAWAALKRASDLCRQLLAYSGKAPLQLSNFDLSDLLRRHTSLLEVSVPRKIAIEYQLAEHLPPIEGDPTQIEQVVMNLMINAAEAIGNASGTITLSTSSRECDAAFLASAWLKEPVAPGRYVCLKVEDSGCGMDAATLERIFDPFYSTKHTGRGLGLAALLGIVRRHHGTLHVTSVVGKGTSFELFFPAAEKQIRDVKVHRTEESTGDERFVGTVLLVDDEPSIRDIGAQLLELLGVHVMTAADGEEALHVFRTCRQMAVNHDRQIRCLILDLTMPRMDGLEAMIELRRLDPELPILLASGYTEEEITARLSEVRPNGFIQKPYSLETLRSKLAPYLSKT